MDLSPHWSLLPQGSMGKAVTITYAHIASLIMIKRGQPYSQVLEWLCCMLSFSLKRPALMCLRGTVDHSVLEFLD